MRTLMIGLMVILLAACGGGGGGGNPPPTHQPPPAPEPIDFPLTVGALISVGVDQGAEHIGTLPAVGERGNVAIRYGRLNDGIGRNELQNALSWLGRGPIERFTSAPELQVIGPASAGERAMVSDAVRAINLSLPPEFRIRIRPADPDRSLRDTVDQDGLYYGSAAPNTIQIEFLPCAAYHGCGGSGATAWTIDDDGNHAIEHAYIQMARGTPAYGDSRQARILIAHEILHALGLEHVTWGSVESIMRTLEMFNRGPASILQPLDREALQVFYQQLDPGDDPADFGAWASTSVHLAGNGLHANFGVALRNGYAEPWAHGPRPRTALADNSALSGSATWNGTLLGFSDEHPVAGDAEIGVRLATLTGSAAFTELESWAPRAAPGAAGTGTTWLDGDLAYTIVVRGNTFQETGGDDGRLTGIFTGAAHEGAAGTLERADLTAAFGASR